ncbi:MAG: peptidylprolyl isomerase [Chloroflexota bacterium]|nr:peptidylprolyl isomerase [Chloroflexota bacterium]
MSSQTVRQPDRKRPARATKSNKGRPYTRQTAHVEARRDGKPLIFGWGGHLSHNEKVRLRRRSTWVMTILFMLLIVVVIVGFWININILVPGSPITSVNGHAIPQSQYHKLLALKTQLELNKLYGPNGLFAQRDKLQQQVSDSQKAANTDTTTVDNLNTQINKLPAGHSTQRDTLNKQLADAKKQLTTAINLHTNLSAQVSNLVQNTIPFEQQLFVASPLGNESVTWLQDDELIREWLLNQPSSVQAKITPTASQVARALNDFKASLPKSGPNARSYSQFLNAEGMSDDDVQTVLTLKVRRDNIQNYLAAKIVSPTYQVLARSMTITTPADAQKVLAQLKKGGDFGKLAAQKSHDNSTNTKGGYLDWLVQGQYAQSEQTGTVDNWLFNPRRTLDEISPVLNENGTYRILQILQIDPSRAVDKDTLKSLKDNALSSWLLEQSALPGVNVTSVDQTMLLDPMNVPTELPQAAPGGTPSVPGGVPGAPGGAPGAPGGAPGQ